MRAPKAAEERPSSDLAAEASAVLTASRALVGVVARSLAPALEQVSLPQFRVLVVLSAAGQPVRSGALAEAVGVHPSTFSRMADRLAAGGWAKRSENPDSRRETLVELTAAGSRLVELVTKRRRAEISTLLSRMDPSERELVRTGLEVFARSAGEPSVDDLTVLGM